MYRLLGIISIFLLLTMNVFGELIGPDVIIRHVGIEKSSFKPNSSFVLNLYVQNIGQSPAHNLIAWINDTKKTVSSPQIGKLDGPLGPWEIAVIPVKGNIRADQGPGEMELTLSVACSEESNRLNNDFVVHVLISASSPDGPDLSFLPLEIKKKENETVLLIPVINVGDKPSSTFEIPIFCNETKLQTLKIEKLDSGETITLSCPVSAGTVWITLDPSSPEKKAGEVLEINEYNNFATILVR